MTVILGDVTARPALLKAREALPTLCPPAPRCEVPAPPSSGAAAAALFLGRRSWAGGRSLCFV